MKKYILLSFLFCLSLVACAQTEKGNFLIGGSLSLSRSSQTISSTDITSTSFNINPSVSYFVMDRFATGLMTSYSYGRSTSESVGGTAKTTSSSEGVGPTVRYYFPLGDKVWMFPEVDYLWNWNHTTLEITSAPTSESKSNNKTLRLGLGVAYFIAKNVGLEGIVYYQDFTTSNSSSSNTTSINFRIGLQIYMLRNHD